MGIGHIHPLICRLPVNSMYRNFRLILIPIFFSVAISISAFGQTDPSGDIRIKLNQEGTRYFKFNFLNQVWVRYNESNPGSTVFGDPQDRTIDIGLRRTRIQMFGQITERAFLYFQFGQNNFNFASPKQVGAFFHDALCEYTILKENRLKIGGGLTILSGLSRFTQPSIGSILTLDVPVFAQATTGIIDQFSRKLSIYARGQLGKVDYRLIVSDPFRPNESILTPNSNFSFERHHKNYQGYVFYQFLEKEPHNIYFNGTYLGSKKLFNLGGGFIYQKDAMWSLKPDTTFHNLFLLAVDAFLELPLDETKGSALSAYASFFSNDYGPNYLRNLGVMNPATGTNANASLNGRGNAFPMMGTGNAFYAQAGYLFRKDLIGENLGTIQPYISMLSARYDALDDPMNVYNAGINYLIKGQNVKISLDYQSRPVFNLNADRIGRRGMYVLQYQIFI